MTGCILVQVNTMKTYGEIKYIKNTTKVTITVLKEFTGNKITIT